MYHKVSTDLSSVEREKAITAFWKENDIYEKPGRTGKFHLF